MAPGKAREAKTKKCGTLLYGKIKLNRCNGSYMKSMKRRTERSGCSRFVHGGMAGGLKGGASEVK